MIIRKEVHVVMAIVFLITSVFFFLGIYKDYLQLKHLALYLGWIIYFGIYLLIAFLAKKQDKKAFEETKKLKKRLEK